MKYQVALIAAMLQSLVLFGQAPQCGTDDIMLRNPFLMDRYNSRVDCDFPTIDLDTAQVLTLPVVVHVLHLGETVGEGTNISDEQVLSCIRNLNERFRGDAGAMSEYTNWNGDQPFDEGQLSLVIDSKIEFCLASRDPDNLPTDGIVRHDCSNLTHEGESYALDGIASSAIDSGVDDSYIKQMFHWPEENYLNFYVVSEIGGNDGFNGTQGYSYVGSLGLGAVGYRYGPVCMYNVTGDIGTLKPGRAMNATWAHEIGHALNLYHTFGVATTAGSGCNEEPNPCTYGDQIPDTPPTSANQSCNPANSDCPDAMLENYMDYTDEDCKTAFTQNQIERMRHEIYTNLPYLISTDNVSCQSSELPDVAITYISTPSEWCLESIDFNVKVNNFSSTPAEGATLIVGGIPFGLDVPTIPPGGYVVVPIYDFLIGDGTIEVEVLYDSDTFPENNVLTQQVVVTEQNWLEVVVSPDIWSNEIDWSIIDSDGEVVLSGGDYPVFSQDETFIEATCLPEGCYTFEITDTAGDGMCGIDFDDDGICDAYYDAFVNILVNSDLVFELSEPEDINYGSELTFNFCSYVCPPVECPTDLDTDGATTVHDLMLVLASIGLTITECSPYDFNNDLQIDINDVLLFMNAYGTTCFGEQIIGETEDDTSEVTPIAIASNKCLVGDPVYFDLTGRQVQVGDLSQGIYIIVENWDDGTTSTRKVFIGGV